MGNDSWYNALFCTAPGLTSKVNELLQHAQNAPLEAKSRFILVQSPSQSLVGQSTAPPVANFESGFLDWSTEQIGDWCKAKFNQKIAGGELPNIADQEFAILDDRTLRDGTVLMVKYDYWDERVEADDPDNSDDAWRDREGYREFRDEMNQVPQTMAGLREMFMSDLLDSIKPENNGVMKWGQT